MKKNFCSLSHLQLAFGFTLLASGVAVGQMRVITGTVTDNTNNKPISGVSIFEEGSDTVATTNSSGIYRVQVSGENPALVFKHPDYPERKVSLGDRVAVDVLLSKENENGIGSGNEIGNERKNESEKAIEEVVLNAGYYKVRDKERTGSISRIGVKDIENQPVTNVLASAQGRMSGVSITQNSGTPGGGFDIQIRGKNSIRRDGNEPLYIIDGVPVISETPSIYSAAILPYASINPLNAINPNDIESFEVLKDADATAIYGSRGANGVIIVTTKKGRKGRTDLKLNTSYSLSSVTNRLKVMGTTDYLNMRRTAFQNDGIATIPANAYDLNTWSQERATNWQKELIGNTAESSVVQLSLSGGSENLSYLISYGHTEQGTVLPAGFQYKSNNLTGNFSYRTPDRRVEVNLTNSLSFQNNNVLNSEVTNRSITLSPNAPALYNADGSLNWENSTFTNPLGAFKSEYLNSTSFINTGTQISYKLFPFVSLKFNGGITYQNFEEFSLRPHTVSNPAANLTSANSTSSKNNSSNFSYILEPQITGDYSWNNHSIDMLIGATLQKSETNQSSMQGIGFESNALIQNIAAAKTKIINDQIINQYNYTAVFARINYKYLKRYILNVTGRRDGSSRFGPNNRFGNFGAVGAAWLISEEDWMKNISWLSFAKLRGSFGTSGNDRIGDYQYLDTYTVSSNIYNNITALNPSRLYNPNFSWEKTLKKEVAAEFSLFKNIWNLSAAYYENTSSNQLVGIPLAATTGFSSIQSNLPAKVQNSGWEFETSFQVFRKSEFKYDTSFNLSIPESKLLEFPNLEGSTYTNQYVIGYPTTLVKVYQYEGINPATGLYQFTDYNGDGKITSPDDNKVIERLGVRFFGGWSNNFRYGQWSASFLWQFVKQRNWNYNRQMIIPGSMNNQPIEVLDVWSATNPSGTYMPYSSGTVAAKNSAHSFFQNSTAAIGDASYIRLKNVQLNYSIPINQLGIKEAIIYVQGQNLLTITKYFGLDPEFILTGFLPPLKTYSVGFQMTF
ncbi:SusC/RagA family TonB-linked outer membrane protein [Chryseobacterium sp. C-39]|uniref:SusC/RagA family TonB-linked outer membrane protein n=2 Tax=Chryseobacterium muglaense TaxID=2893752 RepID=A0A9Q3UY88_9FLAO|nr:SusC/RagA family TonB-linked outer membrane protein [Chryseobacterium muglaense]MBD3903340.1 SusC/RagA family TonB-linked outer membrane protein [Chryseobacterium muglaense]MCC9036168.1 SusC/RagA family TonB-linked outer membrane protein [Chryseobacterium muglaense]